MATIKEKLPYPLKDEDFYVNWFNTQFPIKSLEQIVVIDEMLTLEQVEKALVRMFKKKMSEIPRDKYESATYVKGICTDSNMSKRICLMIEVLTKCFPNDIAYELFGNVAAVKYNILEFMESKIVKCLKNAVNETISEKTLKPEETKNGDEKNLTTEIIYNEVIKMWFKRAVKKNTDKV